MIRDTTKYRILINYESRASTDVWFLRSLIDIRHEVSRRYTCVVWRIVRRILWFIVFLVFYRISSVFGFLMKRHEIYTRRFLYCIDWISLSTLSDLLSRSVSIVHDPLKFSPRFCRRVTLATVVFLRFAVESSLTLIRTASASYTCVSVPSIDDVILVIRTLSELGLVRRKSLRFSPSAPMFELEDLWVFPRRVLTYTLLARCTFVERCPQNSELILLFDFLESSCTWNWASSSLSPLRSLGSVSRAPITSKWFLWVITRTTDEKSPRRQCLRLLLLLRRRSPLSASISYHFLLFLSFIQLSSVPMTRRRDISPFFSIPIETLIFILITTNSHQINLFKSSIKRVR